MVKQNRLSILIEILITILFTIGIANILIRRTQDECAVSSGIHNYQAISKSAVPKANQYAAKASYERCMQKNIICKYLTNVCYH